MHTVDLGDGLESTEIVYGCMRLADDPSAAGAERAFAALDAAYDAGIRHFDHADIYGGGRAEERFAHWLRRDPGLREQLTITSKCGIRLASSDAPQHYDFSAAHIERSVDGSLARLGVEQLDLLLLHRPDYLAGPDELNACVERLLRAGKIRGLGLSNCTATQLRLFNTLLETPLRLHQIELSLAASAALDNGVLDTGLELGIRPQAWSPLGGAIAGHRRDALPAAQRAAVAAELARQASTYGTETWQVALAWVLAHPAGVLPVIGSMAPARIAGAVAATDIRYARIDWYRLLEARNGVALP